MIKAGDHNDLAAFGAIMNLRIVVEQGIQNNNIVACGPLRKIDTMTANKVSL